MLGFIDKTGDGYELVRLRNGLVSERFASLDRAISALDATTIEAVAS